jgi:hypothetical protein
MTKVLRKSRAFLRDFARQEVGRSQQNAYFPLFPANSAVFENVGSSPAKRTNFSGTFHINI